MSKIRPKARVGSFEKGDVSEVCIRRLGRPGCVDMGSLPQELTMVPTGVKTDRFSQMGSSRIMRGVKIKAPTLPEFFV